MEAHSTQTLPEKNKDQFINITLGEASWLFSRLGLTAGELSPLKNIAVTASSDADRSTLAGKGLLDSAGNAQAKFAECMKTAAKPGCEMVIDVGNATILNFMRVYFGPSGSLAGCTPVDASAFRLAPELRLEDILITILEGLNLNESIKEKPVSFELSQKGLLALAALIDATRQNQLRSLLNRNDNVGIQVDFMDIWACLQRGAVEDDFRWLTGVIRSRLPDEMTLSQNTLSEGLAEITAAGLAVRDADSWGMADERIEALTELMTPLNFGSIFARSVSDSETVRLLLIRCPTSLWAVNFRVKSGKISVFTLSTDRLGTIVAEIVARLMVIGQRAPKPNPSVPPPVPSASTAQKTVKKFCPECGKPLKPDARFCAECGRGII